MTLFDRVVDQYDHKKTITSEIAFCFYIKEKCFVCCFTSNSHYSLQKPLMMITILNTTYPNVRGTTENITMTIAVWERHQEDSEGTDLLQTRASIPADLPPKENRQTKLTTQKLSFLLECKQWNLIVKDTQQVHNRYFSVDQKVVDTESYIRDLLKRVGQRPKPSLWALFQTKSLHGKRGKD